ncbi:hypothetical protein B0J17DRAFT_674141 [Rhizoctonia solani]|nr:hypothetical protein B0J17DRAFT_674141 [Rhizoctonia solani]
MSSDDGEIVCTGVHIPGVYSTLPANGSQGQSQSQNDFPTLPVEEETSKYCIQYSPYDHVNRTTANIEMSNTSTRGISPEPVPTLANTNSMVLCLVTQENFPLERCLVLQLSPELQGDAGSRLAHVWGFNSLEGLDFRLKNSSFNRMTLRMDFVPRYGSVYGGHWALVPDLDTLTNILSEVTRANFLRRPTLYLDEFPNEWRVYRYVPLRGDMDKFLRITPGVQDEDGTTRCTLHKFPFHGLELRSNVHPYFAIANAAQKAIHAWGGRSHIPQLPDELRTSLELCIDIYARWLKKRAKGASTRVRN